MQTPNDYLRALLLELAEKKELGDSAIAWAHHAAYPHSTLSPSAVQRFREGSPTTSPSPSPLMEEAYAAATGTTREQNWNEAFQRWRTATKLGAARAVGRGRGRPRARQRSA